MPRIYTPAQMGSALDRFDRGLGAAITRGFSRGLDVSLTFSITAPGLMQGLGTGANAQPPNPPPGPLGIRTGRLRRGMRKYGPKQLTPTSWEGGLTNVVPYFWIHELGGRTRPHEIRPKNKTALRFAGKGPALRGKGPKQGGFWVYAKVVHHPGSRIPARPTAGPALRVTLPVIERLISAELILLAQSAVG